MSPFVKGALYVFLSAFGFGLLPIFAILAYQDGTNVVTVLFFRFMIASAIFFLILLATKTKIRLTWKQAAAMFCLGGLLYTLQSFSYFSAVKYIPSPLAALILYTFPMFVAFLSVWVEKEKLTGRTLFSIGVSFVGLCLVLGSSFGAINWFGALLALAAALFYSVYIILGNRLVQGLPPMLVSGFISLFAASSLLVVGGVSGDITASLTSKTWGGILGVTLFSTVVSIACFFRGLQLISSTQASVLSTIEPLVTLAFSALLFGDRLSVVQMTGGLIVLVGAVLTVMARGQTPEKARVQAE
ncbi:MAG: DMT family transporter [Clostridia bacterium]